jgi:hypothetical protein
MATAGMLFPGCPAADEQRAGPQAALRPSPVRDAHYPVSRTTGAPSLGSVGPPALVGSALPAEAVAPEALVPEPGCANQDSSDDHVVAPPDAIPDCEARLSRAGVRFKLRPLPVHRQGGIECGAPQAIEYREGPTGIRWWPVPVVSCGLGLALARFEAVLQDEAQREFGVGMAAVEQGGTYSCRAMARFRLVSEHSYANALDLRSFRTKNGKTISVLAHFGKPSQEPVTTEGRFLRQLARRAYDEGVFSVVVTRFFDELHRDHVHVDLARYRVDGTR